MHPMLVSSRALFTVSLAAFAAAASAQAPAVPGVPAAKASDATLLEIARGKIRGAVLATARAELEGGAVAMLIASQPRPKGTAYELVVVGDEGGSPALLASDEIEGLELAGAPTVAVAAGTPRVATGALTATVGVKAADGSVEERALVYRFGAGRLTRLLAAPPSRLFPAGSRRQSVRQAIELLPTSAGGFKDLRVRTTTSECDAAGACAEDVELTSYRFDGVRHAERPYPIPFLEKIVASSELPSRGGLVDYSAAAAVDGRLDTAWCEGAPGAGWFEKLELTFVPAQRLKAVSIVPGLGTGDAFREVTRPKRVRVILGDGRKVEAGLADEAKPQRIALPDGERVFGMTLVVVDVYKGKREDACISELDLEVEP
ncbi:MAG TPA: hypothetical protein VLT47_10050 [Anaeromyxobacteraceae bacterium]|nr:hypothetical protein [Anaeromyxobacteraceae bacterium]